MPIYEYYCPETHKIYQFFAKTLAQGRTIPKCPDNPAFTMRKVISSFAVSKRGKESGPESPPNESTGDPAEDARMEAAMSAMESEFSNVDENDPRAMGRMMRRMAELTGEKIGGEMEEVVRKLEEGADPESLEEELGDEETPNDPYGEGPMPPSAPAMEIKEGKERFRVRRAPPQRDPKLYDYD